MTTMHLCNKQIDTIHVLAVGEFGVAIASTLKELLPDLIETHLAVQDEFTANSCPEAQLHILASWRPTSALCQLFEEISYTHNSFFMPAFMSGPVLQIGPVIVPGVGTCYTCYEKRFYQHSPLQALYRDIYTYYDNHPESGPQGYLQAFADIAALKLQQLIDIVNTEPAKVAGHLWRWNSITLEGLQSIVTGIHACPRCGLQRDETRRSYEEMHQSLHRLFSWDVRAALSADNPTSISPWEDQMSPIGMI